MSSVNEDRKIQPIYLHAEQVKEANVLIKKHNYTSFSDLVRKLIDKEYKLKVKDPEEELRKAIAERDEMILSLEQIIKETSSGKVSWEAKYSDRRSNMSITALSSPKYVEQSKKWIKTNISELNKIFPGMNVDDIYNSLEDAVDIGKTVDK